MPTTGAPRRPGRSVYSPLALLARGLWRRRARHTDREDHLLWTRRSTPEDRWTGKLSPFSSRRSTPEDRRAGSAPGAGGGAGGAGALAGRTLAPLPSSSQGSAVGAKPPPPLVQERQELSEACDNTNSTGLAQIAGRVQVSDRDSQARRWATSRNFSQPWNSPACDPCRGRRSSCRRAWSACRTRSCRRRRRAGSLRRVLLAGTQTCCLPPGWPRVRA